MSSERRINSSQWGLIALILALAAARVTYGLLRSSELRQTSALFIGLPAVLAIIIALTPKAKSATGMIIKGMSIAILMSGILLFEGFVCILMAAPLFYAVGIFIGRVVDDRRQRSGGGRALGIILLPLLLMSLEGTSEQMTLARSETVTVRSQVAATPDQIEHAVAEEPRFDVSLPLYLQLGFPRPAYANGSGLNVVDTRVIGFAVGRQPPRELILKVIESRSGYVRFEAIRDDTPVADWLRFEEAIVEWEAASPGQSFVSWTIQYERQLDPAWYFGPMRRYAVGLAAEYLIATVATPVDG